MLTNRHQVTIEWGHCDPAGIVYFPNYFTYFDFSTNALFLRALGFNKYEMLKVYDIVGIPLVDVQARFIVPSVFGDVVTIESSVEDIKRSSFRMPPKPGRPSLTGFDVPPFAVEQCEPSKRGLATRHRDVRHTLRRGPQPRLQG